MAYHENIICNENFKSTRMDIYIRYLKTHGLRCLKMTLHCGTTIADTQTKKSTS